MIKKSHHYKNFHKIWLSECRIKKSIVCNTFFKLITNKKLFYTNFLKLILYLIRISNNYKFNF